MSEQLELLDLTNPLQKRAAWQALLTELQRHRDWTAISVLARRLPWLTANRMHALLRSFDQGHISSTARGYLLTSHLTPEQNRAAERYLRTRIRTQTARLLNRRRYWHSHGHHPA